MRKFIASIILCTVILGTFMPFSFSADGVQGNVASAQIATTPPATPPVNPYQIPITPSSSDNTSTTTSNPATSINPATGAPWTQQEIQDEIDSSPYTVKDDGSPLDCGITDIFCGMFKLIITFILFIPNSITVVSGLLMDLSLWTSISPVVYGIGGSSLEVGLRTAWTIVRDFANIGFIFALFVAAFSLIVGKDLMGFKPKDTVVRVIIMALLVNFSFFMCRVIIQFADVFSHVFYNQITSESRTDGDIAGFGNFSVSELATQVGVKTPSLSIVSRVNPQTLMLNGVDPDTWQVSGVTGFVRSLGGILDVKNWSFYVEYGTMAVITWIMLIVLMYTFIIVSLIFLGRIFGLWLAIIFSPIAFVSHAIPSLADNPYFGFKNWLENLVKLALTTPIFLFFLYLALNVLQLQNLLPDQIKNSSSMVGRLVAGMLPAFGAIFIILKGKKIATEMSGEVGKFVGGLTGWATTLALGAATGGTAMLARQTVGRGGAMLANSMKGDNSAVGKGLRNIGTSLGAASFDVRKSEYAMKGLSKFTTAAGEPVDLGTRGLREGGFMAEGTLNEQWRKRQERIAKEVEEKKKKEAEDAKLNAQAKDAKELRENESKLEMAKKAKEAEDATINMEAENQGPGAFMAKKTNDLNKVGGLIEQRADLEASYVQFTAQKAMLQGEEATLMADRINLQNEMTTLLADKATLEAALSVAPAGSPAAATLATQITAKNTEIAAKQTAINTNSTAMTARTTSINAINKEIDKNDEAIVKKEAEINKTQSYINTLTTLNVQSVRDARQKKVDLELEAEHSEEKTKSEKAEEKMKEKDKIAKDLDTEIRALKKKADNLANGPAKDTALKEIEDKKAELMKKQKDYQDAKTDHKKLKKAYDDMFGNKIKALEDFEKDALKTYQEDPDVVLRKRIMQNAVIDAQKSVNASRNNIENLDYQYQQKYAEDLIKDAQVNQSIAGDWAGKIGTISGGRVMGGSVRNANQNAATGVIQGITGPTVKKTDGGDKTK